MNTPTGDNDAIMRARELEIEVARLNAELETLRGEGEPTDIAARFLSMAATTVDQAMTDARREADELAAEVSAAAEARRDEATRIAEEAEARTDALRTEAAESESVVEQARTEAADITAAAEAEAEALIAAERNRVAEEIERLSAVRTALEDERGALESYHDELKRRVQELAESMVAFMTTEPPMAAAAAIEDLTAPELAVVTDPTAVVEDESVDGDEIVEDEPVEEFVAEAVEVEAEVEDIAIEDTADEIVDATDEIVAEADEVADEPVEFVAEVETDETEIEDEAEVIEPIAEVEVVEEFTAPASPFAAFAQTTDTETDDTVVETDEIDEAEVAEPVAETVSSSPIDWSAGTASDLDADTEIEDEVAEPVSPLAAAPGPFDAPIAPVADEAPAANPFGDPSVPAKPVEPSSFYDAPAAPTGAAPSFSDMMAPPAPPVPPAPAGPATEPTEPADTAEFGGVPVVERETTAAGLPTRRPRLGGLFGRGTGAAAEQAAQPTETPAVEETPKPAGGLFGSHGARLIEQTSKEELAAALADDSAEDERFRSFLDGDDDADPSRDWLLRPEQS